jgi:hypothetical protein
MMRKMLDDIENSAKAGDSESLNGIRPGESRTVQLAHHAVSLSDCLAQPREKSTAGDGADFTKLLVALAAVDRATQS